MRTVYDDKVCIESEIYYDYCRFAQFSYHSNAVEGATVDGVHQCFLMEDVDSQNSIARNICSRDPASHIKAA